MSSDRKAKLLGRIQEAREISLTRLSEEFQVSELTIRRDLKPLEESRKIKISKGEVLFIPDDPFSSAFETEPDEEIIAGMAASEIKAKDRIIWLGNGNISLGIARRIENVTLATNSLLIASAALKRKDVKVHLLGDEVDPESHCLFGKSLEMIRDFTFNKVFMEVDGYFNKRFLLSSRMAETVSFLTGNALEKFILIRGLNFGNVNTARLKGQKECNAVFTDTLGISIKTELEKMPLRVICQNVQAEKRDEKIIPLTKKFSHRENN